MYSWARGREVKGDGKGEGKEEGKGEGKEKC